MDYKIKVLGNDKKVYEVSEFVASGKTYKDAIGIVFGTPIIGQRILAFDSWTCKWGDTNSVLTEEHNEAQAVQILCGLDDTRRIVEAQKNMKDITAAKICWKYGIGDLRWYLPSVMELGALSLCRDEINEAMKQLGCEEYSFLPTEDSDSPWVWSSSECGQGGSWYVYFVSGGFNNVSKGYSSVVRAVAEFPQPTSPSLFSGEAKSKDTKMSDEELVTMLRERGYSGELTKTILI